MTLGEGKAVDRFREPYHEIVGTNFGPLYCYHGLWEKVKHGMKRQYHLLNRYIDRKMGSWPYFHNTLVAKTYLDDGIGHFFAYRCAAACLWEPGNVNKGHGRQQQDGIDRTSVPDDEFRCPQL
jgi:hypothetical protein